MSRNIYVLSDEMKEAKALATMYAMRNDGEVTDELVEIINKSTMKYEDKVDGYIKMIKYNRVEIDVMQKEIKRMKEFIIRTEHNNVTMQNALGVVMGKESYESIAGKITGHLDVGVDYLDTPANTPDDFCEMVEQKPKRVIVKSKVKEYLEKGGVVKFARLVKKKRIK
jgi:hypothetical protein